MGGGQWPAALVGPGLERPPGPRADPRPRRPPVRGLPRVRVHAARPAGPAEDGLQPGRAGKRAGPTRTSGLRPQAPHPDLWCSALIWL